MGKCKGKYYHTINGSFGDVDWGKSWTALYVELKDFQLMKMPWFFHASNVEIRCLKAQSTILMDRYVRGQEVA